MSKQTAYFKAQLPDASDDLTGLKKNRLKVGSESFDTPDQVKAKILAIIAKAPATPGYLQKNSNYSQPQIWRYCNTLAKEGKIAKQGEYWTVTGTTHQEVARERIEDLVDKSKFMQLPELSDYILHAKNMNEGSRFLSKLRGICTGKVVPGFKVHPANWTAETTLAFIKAWRQFTGKERMTFELRQLIRYVHQYILHQPITDTQKEQWGLDGKIDVKGVYAHIKMSDDQIEAFGQFFMDMGELETAAYVRGGIEIFARPQRWFSAELAKFEVIEKSQTLAHVEGFDAPVKDPQMQVLLRLQSGLKVTFETKTNRILTGQVYESKTDKTWTKFIKAPGAVKIVQEYMKTRKGKVHFFAGAESWPHFMERMSVNIRAGFKEMGITEKYCMTKPLYTMRHFGAHLWLKRTGYNYGAVAEMGWEDLQTLRKWYGAFDHAQLDRYLVE